MQPRRSSVVMCCPTIITVYKDKSFTFITKQPPASNLLKKVANIASGSGEANKKKVAKITKAQLLEATKLKMADLNTTISNAPPASWQAPPARWASKSSINIQIPFPINPHAGE
jgi:hypothetical protein